MEAKLTEADFARRCAYMASHIASWAGDTLILPEQWSEPIKVETVARFTDGIRSRLDYLDECAGRSLPVDPRPSSQEGR